MTRKLYYERDLPHWQPRGATFFLTYRLAGSIPQHVLRSLRQDLAERELTLSDIGPGHELERKIEQFQRWSFGRLEGLLDGSLFGPTWLERPEIAQIVADSWQYCAEHYVDLWAYTLMPNHVHALLRHRPDAPLLCDILQRHKSFTGRHANQVIARHGRFWQRETYDHVVRTEREFFNILNYIVQNPVKAQLVQDPGCWPWTFVHPKYKD